MNYTFYITFTTNYPYFSYHNDYTQVVILDTIGSFKKLSIDQATAFNLFVINTSITCEERNCLETSSNVPRYE